MRWSVGTASRLPTDPTDPTDPVPPPGACTATYTPAGAWSNGFQASVTVKAGTAAINGWRVTWTFPGAQTVSQVWSGKYTAGGSLATVGNESWNGTLPADGSTTFGLLGNGPAPAAVNNLACATT